MKRCKICKHIENNNARPACAKCGEASWELLPEVAAVVPSKPEPIEDASAPSPAPVPERRRRRL
jgi:hypothetical protein